MVPKWLGQMVPKWWGENGGGARLGLVLLQDRRVAGQRMHLQFENNYFTEICSGSEAGSYLRLIDFVYHSTLGLRVIKKKKRSMHLRPFSHGALVFKARRLLYRSTLGLRAFWDLYRE